MFTIFYLVDKSYNQLPAAFEDYDKSGSTHYRYIANILYTVFTCIYIIDLGT